MKKKTSIWIYVLAIYVVIQLIWWGVHLIQLTQEISGEDSDMNRRVLMIIGEGCVFFVILLLGLIKIRSSLKKEREFNEGQKNFLLAVTHELKTPLTSTQLNVQTLQKRNLDENQKNLLLEHIQSDTTRLSVLIDNILKITQIDNNNYQLSKTKVDLSKVLDKVIARHALIYSECEFLNQTTTSLQIDGDPDAIDTILSNLIHNAIKYGKGKIVISNDQNSISIEDNGKGIPEKQRITVFKRFKRLVNEETRSVQGTGIGLYLTKHLVELHGWDVRIESSQQLGGAKFIIEF